MKVLVLTSKERIMKFSDLSIIPDDWEVRYLGVSNDNQKILEVGRDADFIFADAIQKIDRELINAMPNLKLIQSEGVAYNSFDVEAATKRGIAVCNQKAANAEGVAEAAILLMLAVLRRVIEGNDMVKAGKQIEAKGSFIMDGITELSACRVGLVGLGAIAVQTALRLAPFGANVSYWNRTRKPELEDELGIDYMELDELLASCDIISLHVAVTPETANMIDANAIAKMKDGAILINTARGDLVDQEALAAALESGKVYGAGLDTLTPEPV
ncbi:MAG: GyaR protein, partial [Actinobacteria bacterium]|nr:GyaR protein [Actinomycetota bacterium]